MALPDTPLTRGEQYLAKAAGQDTAIPDVPLTRMEQYLAKIAGQDVALPDAPLTRIEAYLDEIAKNGGGSSVTVEPLTVTQNGTQTAPSGKAYSPVTVNVENPMSTEYNLYGVFGAELASGTLAEPLGSGVSLDGLSLLLREHNVVAFLDFTFNGVQIHDAPVVSWANHEIEIYSVNASTATNASDLMAFGVRIDTSSGDAYGFAYMNGAYQDMTQYLPFISTTMRIYHLIFESD